MGTIQHDAVIVTFDAIELPKWYEFLESVCLNYTTYVGSNPFNEKMENIFAVSPLMTNNTVSIIMFPDGSKEGWDTSNVYNELRKQFLTWIKTLHYAKYVHITYGELDIRIMKSSHF